MTLALLALAIFVPMIGEALRASRNERLQLSRGGVEPADDVYGLMRLAYPGLFVLMLTEGAVRGAPRAAMLAAGLGLFVAAKVVKWSAIQALGRCWTFRVIVVPGEPLVRRGPYRFLRHPNYVGVIGEIVGVALMTSAAITGPIALVLFGLLMRARIRVEERALRLE